MELRPGKRIKDCHLVGEMINIGDRAATSIVNCTLERCNVIIDAPRGGPLILNSRLTDCGVEVTPSIKDTEGFMHASYIRCRFIGSFSDVDFGRTPWPDDMTNSMSEHGQLVDCDFRSARLHLCRFFNADVNSQMFAPWPQFVIRMEQLRAYSPSGVLPGKLGVFLGGRLKENTALTAVTGIAGDFKNQYHVTESELVQFLTNVGVAITS
jgi:hypothetical protein